MNEDRITKFREPLFSSRGERSCTLQVPACAESVHYKLQTLHSRDASILVGEGFCSTSDESTPPRKKKHPPLCLHLHPGLITSTYSSKFVPCTLHCRQPALESPLRITGNAHSRSQQRRRASASMLTKHSMRPYFRN